jgi:YfiH family protein
VKLSFIRCEDSDGVYFRAPGLTAPHRFTSRTGRPAQSPLLARQIHSDNVIYVTGDGSYTADGFITDRPGLTIAVKTADCTPVLMYDDKAGTAAAVHAGWRGTVAGIVLRAYEKMLSSGAAAESIRVAIGPSVCFDCYEVNEDFRIAVRERLGSGICDMFVREKANRLHADVAGMNAQLLRDAGVPDINIAESGLCTFCLPGLFYSYRRDGVRDRCQWNIIAVPDI